MIAWLLIILGFIISCLIVPPIGPIIYLICVIIFLIIVKIIKASASTSTHALNAIGNVITSFVIGLFSFVYRKYAEKLYKKQLYSIVKEHFNILSEKYKELVYVGDYGETIYDKWYEEVDRFIAGVIKKQKSNFTLSDDELKTRIIKIFDEINNQKVNQK